MSKLIIVESPGKIKKIKSLLDSTYTIMASVGHIRDLASSSLSIDIEDNFKPHYEIISDKKKVVSNLKQAVKNATDIYIAADGDREGEAIAYHLVDVLGIKLYKRIVFNEITQTAINTAIENYRQIDLNMFYSQQTRRILDRIVGYKLSPLLKSIPNIESNSLGAGRVQSVVVKIIVDKEEEIKNFLVSDASSVYVINGEFIINDHKLTGKYYNSPVTKTDIKQIVLNIKKDPNFIINNIEIKTRFKNPSQPFITSTLQQEASYKLKFQLKKTMMIAQKLYEKGLITYMRTDSPTLSNDALSYIKKQIIEDPNLGESYYQFRQFKSKSSNAQEAHEAIRPTNFKIVDLEKYDLTDSDEEKLYMLIYNRTLSTQMKPAEYSDTNITITNSVEQTFNLVSSILVFDGFLKIYIDINDSNNSEIDDNKFKLNTKELIDNKVSWNKINFNETFKDAPTRYNEASLVKKLETLGIGRPSTYAAIISKIQEHKYISVGNITGIDKKITNYILHYNDLKFDKKSTVQKIGYEKLKLLPTSDGILVTKYLIDNFNQIIEYKFTSDMESLLDEIAQGTKIWYEVLDNFYQILKSQLDNIVISENVPRSPSNNHIDIGIHPKYGKITYVETKYGPTFKIKKGKKDMFVSTDKVTTIDDQICKLAISKIDNKITYI